MHLTATQRATLKTDILANTSVIPAADPTRPWVGAFAGMQVKDVPNNSDGHVCLAGFYSQLATPDYWVWKTAVSKEELTTATSVDNTTFTWVGNGFITRSAGEQAAWRELFSASGFVNASLANVRQAFNDIFSGAGNAAANRTHLLAVSRRKANIVEQLLKTSGNGTTAVPAVMGAEGDLEPSDVATALNE